MILPFDKLGVTGARVTGGAFAAAVLLVTLSLSKGGGATTVPEGGWPTRMPTAAPQAAPTVLWAGGTPVATSLDVQPLGVSPDGVARALVRVVFRDANGEPTVLRRGGDVAFSASRGTIQWQTRLRYGGPAAIASLDAPGPVRFRAVVLRPAGLPAATATWDPGPEPRAVAAAIGPHLVRVGWFPRPAHGTVAIETGRGTVRAAAAAGSWDDADPTPGSTADYRIVLPALRPAQGDRVLTATAAVPPELPDSSLAPLAGKAAWLAFSGDPMDADAFTALDVPQIVATAQAAGIGAVELRMAYGAFDEVTAAAKPTIDALIDGLDAAGIAVVGWTVPRTLGFDDLAEAEAVAAYRTPEGHPIRGLAVDLERGSQFLGSGATARHRIATYLGVLRRALGPRSLLVATVEDPEIEQLDAAAYPYRAVAASADALQPMVYWRAVGRSGPAAAATSVAGSLRRLRALAGGTIPIDVGVQTRPLGRGGAPSPAELAAAADAARRAGAYGIALYDWSGTAPPQWAEIASLRWRAGSSAREGLTSRESHAARAPGVVHREGTEPAEVPAQTQALSRGI